MKRLLLALFLLWPALASAQGTITPSPFQTVLDQNGDPINAACIWTYVAGSSTPVDTYTSSDLMTANSNPIIADPAGRFTAFLVPGNSYKFQYETACTPPAHGTIFRTADNISAVPGIAAGVDVVGTAGENIAAGECAYLSDGSNSKTAGSWFLCDADAAYSNTSPVVALAPNAISSGDTGSFRISGQVTGLSGLVVGGHYFVSSTAGAFATAGYREIGQADSATSLIVTGANPARLIPISPPGGRLSLETGVCVSTTDQTAKTTVYYVPCAGNVIALYNGTAWQTFTFSELSIAVPSTTNTLYDVFVYNNSGTLTLELTAWTNDTTRATAITLQDGVYVKSGSTTRRYVGSFRTTGSSGQTEDSLAKRYVWNMNNRVPRAMRVLETTDTWTVSDNTIRQANGAAGNQLDFVMGVQDAVVEAQVIGNASSNAANSGFAVGIGLDSTTARDAACVFDNGIGFNTGTPMGVLATLRKTIAVGRHVLVWLEQGAANPTVTTWYGDTAGNGVAAQSGISGIIWN